MCKAGILPRYNKFLISFLAISNIIGKLLTGWISDFNWIDSFSLYNVYIILCGVSVFFLPSCNSYGLFVVVVAFYGFFTTYFVLKTIVLVELLGLDSLTSAFSLLSFFEGIAGIIGTPIAGAIYDSAGSYEVPFYVAGTFFILAGVLSLAAQLLHRKKKKQQ